MKLGDYDDILNKTGGSCPGPVKISYNILKRLPNWLKANICLLITGSINSSNVPTAWKESQIKILPKPNKNKKDAKNYRPISLTNCTEELWEIAITNIVLAHSENNDVLGEMQNAYRSYRCTIDNLFKLTQLVKNISMVRKFGICPPRYWKSVRCIVDSRTSKQTTKN